MAYKPIQARRVGGARAAALALLGIVIGFGEKARAGGDEPRAVAVPCAEDEDTREAEAPPEREQQLGHDGRIVTSSHDITLKFWDARLEQASLPLRGHQGLATSVDFHPDGRHLLSAGSDRTLKVWNARMGRLVHELRGSTKPVWCAVYSQDGRMIASAGGNRDKPGELGEVILWDAATGRMLHVWNAHESVAWSVSFGLDGKQLVSAGGELVSVPGDLIVWDCATFEKLRTITAPTTFGIHAVAFSPAGSRLASTGSDGSVSLWDLTRGRTLLSLAGHASPVTKAVFSHDGRRLISASADQSVRVWDVETADELLCLRSLGGQSGASRSAGTASESHPPARTASSESGAPRRAPSRLRAAGRTPSTRSPGPARSASCRLAPEAR
jgi:WD40 repeat protein